MWENAKSWLLGKADGRILSSCVPSMAVTWQLLAMPEHFPLSHSLWDLRADAVQGTVLLLVDWPLLHVILRWRFPLWCPFRSVVYRESVKMSWVSWGFGRETLSRRSRLVIQVLHNIERWRHRKLKSLSGRETALLMWITSEVCLCPPFQWYIGMLMFHFTKGVPRDPVCHTGAVMKVYWVEAGQGNTSPTVDALPYPSPCLQAKVTFW